MEPITFKPLYMERVWGGRELERVYGRTLPRPGVPYGESWEISDRADEQSMVDGGPFDGKTLHELWTEKRGALFGSDLPDDARFPLLIKILDARDDLSIQVHPPVGKAVGLGGDPKTEMWFIAAAEPGARLYAGLREGVTRESFERAIHSGEVADCLHVLEPRPGDSIFIPSGRLHAIGAGLLIHEIQQNSDTTYRVFDWNRPGLDGRPREMHVDESLASIDFSDHAPGLDVPQDSLLAECPYFRTRRHELPAGSLVENPDPERFSIVGVVDGALESEGGRNFGKGAFLLLPRGADPLRAVEDSVILQVEIPS